MATYKTGWMKKLINGVSTKIFAISHVKSVYYNYGSKKTLSSKLDEIDESIYGCYKKCKTSKETDLNNVTNPGMYEFPFNTSRPYTNVPTSGSTYGGFYLEVITLDYYKPSIYDDRVVQIALIDFSVWVRHLSENSWGSWKFSHNLDTGSTVPEAFSYSPNAKAYDVASFAAGYYVEALKNQVAAGHYNDTSLATDNKTSGASTTGSAFVIGNGTSSSKSNAFRVRGDGVTYAKGAYNATGADYAEFSEWADGNTNDEDRRGYFVTFDEEKPNMIRKADAGDYILGIVSGNPCIIGNSDEDWIGRYVFDEFGTIQYEEVEEEEEYIDKETGEKKTRTVTITKYKENPDYDPEREYVQRENRKEWSAVGWIGVLSVRDDNTCQPGGYCKVSDGGIATTSERGKDTYKVLERVTDNVIKVVLK